MKIFLVFIVVLVSLSSFSQRKAIHITPNQLIEKKIDWDKLDVKKPDIKKELILSLIEQKKVFLCYSGNIQQDKDLDKFLETHESNFHLLDLNADGVYELVYNGFDCGDKDNEFIYFYTKMGDQYEIAYSKKGNLIGYKINPHTKEVLLIHFNYPCCRNGTNNLNTLRYVNGKITEHRKEFFAGRIDFMKGPFLPDSIDRKGKIIATSKTIELRWSPEIVYTMAWEGTVQKNIILSYEKGSKFRVLAEQKNKDGETWLFVISRTPPVLTKGYIVEPTNFKTTKVYGWIRKDDY